MGTSNLLQRPSSIDEDVTLINESRVLGRVMNGDAPLAPVLVPERICDCMVQLGVL